MKEPISRHPSSSGQAVQCSPGLHASARFFHRIPFDRVNWLNSSFLIGTLLLALTAVPLYLWHFGLDWFQVGLFVAMFCLVGFSITLGYHRLFTHLAFQAHWSVRLFTLVFGAAAFENSVLLWACDHRAHHRHVDHEEDPYNISDGFFQAHVGWLLFKLKPPLPWDNVADLQKSALIMWQHRNFHWIAGVVAFALPTAAGYAWGGWVSALGAFLIAGVARVVVLQHCTFCINSLCHYVGRQPYSLKCSARDSWLTALVTFGEGYHNYHHAFPGDYRNGVKPWQLDPTKWIIWVLAKVGLADQLRRVPAKKIREAQLAAFTRKSVAADFGGQFAAPMPPRVASTVGEAPSLRIASDYDAVAEEVLAESGGPSDVQDMDSGINQSKRPTGNITGQTQRDPVPCEHQWESLAHDEEGGVLERCFNRRSLKAE